MIPLTISELTLSKYARLGGANTRRLSNQLCSLPCPSRLRIGLRQYHVPADIEDLKRNICWGQRLLMATPHESDLETILYFTANYFAPKVGQAYSATNPYTDRAAHNLLPKLRATLMEELMPVTNKLVKLFNEMVKQEKKRLESKPNKIHQAAGIDKLRVFSDWASLEVIAEKARIIDIERNGLTVSYNTAITILAKEKELADFQDRYNRIIEIQNAPKKKR